MHGFEYERGQGERDRDELSLQFWLLAVDLDGEQSSQELSFGLFSFARSLICSQRNFGRAGGRSERGLSSRSTDIASLVTSIRFSTLAVSG